MWNSLPITFLPPVCHQINLSYIHFHHWLHTSNTCVNFILTSRKNWTSLFRFKHLPSSWCSLQSFFSGWNLCPSESIVKAEGIYVVTKYLYIAFPHKGWNWNPNLKAWFKNIFVHSAPSLCLKLCFLPFVLWIYILKGTQSTNQDKCLLSIY